MSLTPTKTLNDPTPPLNPNEWLKEVAARLGLPKKRLLVLAEKNDPFNAGTEAHIELAQWFARIFDTVAYQGVHLRRLHYRAYDSTDPRVTSRHEGPYENTGAQWKELSDGGRYARFLGLVDPESFVDQRAPAPHENAVPNTWGNTEPSYTVEPPEEWQPCPLSPPISVTVAPTT